MYVYIYIEKITISISLTISDYISAHDWNCTSKLKIWRTSSSGPYSAAACVNRNTVLRCPVDLRWKMAWENLHF